MSTYELKIGPAPYVFKYKWKLYCDDRLIDSGDADTIWGCRWAARQRRRLSIRMMKKGGDGPLWSKTWRVELPPADREELRDLRDAYAEGGMSAEDFERGITALLEREA